MQENAARIHLREATRLLDAVAPTTAAAQTDADSREGCGCGADAETDEAPVTTEEPVAASSGHTPGCGALAAQFAARGASAAMPSCRQKVGRFTSTVSSAETDKALVAATATRAHNEEARR